MTPIPVLHTADCLLAGKVWLYVDAPATAVDQVIFYEGPTNLQIVNNQLRTGFDGLSIIVDAPAASTQYVAKFHDAAGYGTPSAPITAQASAGPPPPPPPPPPLTQREHLQAALSGVTINVGDDVLTAAPSVVRKVNADGTIS